MKAEFNQSTETIISNKELNVSPVGELAFISAREGWGGLISYGDGGDGSIGIKPAI